MFSMFPIKLSNMDVFGDMPVSGNVLGIEYSELPKVAALDGSCKAIWLPECDVQ